MFAEHLLGYVLDEENVDMIMKKFETLDQIMKEKEKEKEKERGIAALQAVTRTPTSLSYRFAVAEEGSVVPTDAEKDATEQNGMLGWYLLHPCTCPHYSFLFCDCVRVHVLWYRRIRSTDDQRTVQANVQLHSRHGFRQPSQCLNRYVTISRKRVGGVVECSTWCALWGMELQFVIMHLFFVVETCPCKLTGSCSFFLLFIWLLYSLLIFIIISADVYLDEDMPAEDLVFSDEEE